NHAGDSESFSIDSQQLVKAPGGGSDVEQMQNAIRDALDDALARAVNEAAALIALSAASDDKLVEKLGSAQPAEAAAAVRLLVRKHHKAALPALLARLSSDDLNELRGVIGQLVELGAPEAVNPLIEAARHKGPVFEREVVFAVGSIGGDDAEAYLDFVVSGHDDELIRASAEQALKELRAKKPRPPSGENP
ncbi:MAG TPA: HEAT repeat domain-containing protein, partial [Archangium sp.]